MFLKLLFSKHKPIHQLSPVARKFTDFVKKKLHYDMQVYSYMFWSVLNGARGRPFFPNKGTSL